MVVAAAAVAATGAGTATGVPSSTPVQSASVAAPDIGRPSDVQMTGEKAHPNNGHIISYHMFMLIVGCGDDD
jgi:hypothetical protein